MTLRLQLRCARTILALLLAIGGVVALAPGGARAADDEAVNQGFLRVWQRTDLPAARGDRTFMWGPKPVLPLVIGEPMAGLAGDERPVLYYDKARMEVNDPTADPTDPYYVTNGLLVSEMVEGRIQVGVNPTRYAERAPADIPFGDLEDPTGPTYRSFRGHLQDAPLAVGQPVAQQIDRAGQVSAGEAGGVTCQTVVPETRHCIAAPFWDFLNQTGAVFDPASRQVQQGRLFDPLYYATGLPISEAYWITVRAAGKPTRVLIQLFERRTLTYNPANGPASRVEMGNVGLQYYHWRYDALLPGDAPTGLDPAMRAAIEAITTAGPGYPYLPQAVARRYQLLFQHLTESQDAYGFADRDWHIIAVDAAYAATPRDAGVILVHEMQHARDFTALGDLQNASECYAFEARGFLTELSLWQTWYGPSGKAGATDPLEREENSLLRQLRANPDSVVRNLIRLYTENGECTEYPATGDAARLLTLEGLPAGIEGQLPVEQVFAALRAQLAGGQVVAAREPVFGVVPTQR